MRTYLVMNRLGCLLLLLLLARPASADLLSDFAADDTGASAAAVTLARRAFDAYVLRRERITPPDGLPELLGRRGAVFVSAQRNGAPRCCMGSLYPTRRTLAQEIIAAAVAAAGMDARRRPVKPEELPKLQLIVSLVAPPEAITDPTRLDPLQEGLAVRSAVRTGVVLPLETRRLDRMIAWSRLRAAAAPGESVEYFRVRAYRILEPRPEP